MAKQESINLQTTTPSELQSFGLSKGSITSNPKSKNDFGSSISLPVSEVLPFGAYKSSLVDYPNDVVRLDIYNANNQYLETTYRVANYSQQDFTVTTNPEQDLSSLGYVSGRYRVEYKFHRNILGAGDAHKMQIQEVSADGLEIRIVPSLATQLDNYGFLEAFRDSLFIKTKSRILTNLTLFKNATTFTPVFDYIQDRFTFPDVPYSIILKFPTPISDTFFVNDFVWLAQQVSDDLIDNITLTPPRTRGTTIKIAGPNWDVLSKTKTVVSTPYKDWDDMLSSQTTTSQDIVNKLLSGSLVEGIDLNIDYKEFKNYINFGSATERLNNFKYKAELIENYNARIQQLSSALSGLPSSSVSSSLYFLNNITDAQNKKAALLGAFDQYEKYLYYESSSYVTNSYGEFYPTTWPKSTSIKPYANFSFTSSQAQEWFDGIIKSASVYDQNNLNALYKTIPAHILEDEANDQYVLFVNMIGHYFDLIFAYIKELTKIHNRDQSLTEGFSKQLVYELSRNLGVDFENGATLEELWGYTLGTNVSGSIASTYYVTTEDKTKEIWKRIINNLPHLLKTKGTERGVRALINCFGIPQTILRIREYGGPEPDFDTKTDLVYERFFYSTTVGYNGGTSGQVAQLINVPWKQLNANGLIPMGVELRVKMALSQSKTQTIMEVPNKWKVEAFQSGSGNYVAFYLSGSQGWATASVSSSIYNGDFHLISLQRNNASDAYSSGNNQRFTLGIRQTNYQKVVATTTASLVVSGSNSGSYIQSFITSGNLWIPGSGSFPAASSHSMAILSGSVQELRYWSSPLQEAVLDNHALAPTSFQGPLADTFTGSTSSFYDLGFRLCLGSDNKKTNFATTTSFTSQHPNQQDNTFVAGFKSASFFNFSGSFYNPVTEIHSLEWPDLGGNRSVSNKIRIDETVTAGEVQLFRNTKVQKSISDNNPPDSPRLGVYLSPLNETNQDIAEQFGGLSIDDFIGNPTHLDDEVYPDLERLQHEYFKKYTGNAKAQNYIRLIQHFDAALFQLIKKFIPYRANAQVGLVVEPSILHRSKIPTRLPVVEENHYSSSIVMPDTIIPAGAVQDGDGEPFRDGSGYVQGGTIETEYVRISGQEQQARDVNKVIQYPDRTYLAQQESILTLRVTGNANQFNNTGIADLPSQSGSLAGTVDLGKSSYGRDVRVQGSQYLFMSYATSQSISIGGIYGTSLYGSSTYASSSAGTTSTSLPYKITASRYDYHEALGPVIINSRLSQTANVTNENYDTDIYFSRAFQRVSSYTSGAASNYETIYSSSEALYQNRWTVDYGLRIESLYVGGTLQSTPFSTTAYWGLTGSLGLYFKPTSTSQQYTGSIKLPAFFWNNEDGTTHNYVYKITIQSNETNPVTAGLELHLGDLDCGITQSVTSATQSFTIQPNGPWLGLRVRSTIGLTLSTFYITSLKVECINYRSQIQDYHLRDSKGMVNARYEGCKMTSPDWNADSNDTVDKGPVVVVLIGKGNQLLVEPKASDGTFRVLSDV